MQNKEEQMAHNGLNGVTKKQTAVEWLEDNLIGNPFSEKDFAHNVNVFKQAKEMEKQQIIDALHYFGIENAQDYYNETYGG